MKQLKLIIDESFKALRLTENIIITMLDISVNSTWEGHTRPEVAIIHSRKATSVHLLSCKRRRGEGAGERTGRLISYEAGCPVHGKYGACLSTCFFRRSALLAGFGEQRGFWKCAKATTRCTTAKATGDPF